MNQGEPYFFDINAYLYAVSMMINADEVERALWMLDNPPAYYRDNPPKELIDMKERLHKQLWTPIQYRGIYESIKETTPQDTENHWPLRAQILEKEVKELNQAGIEPNIMELAPGAAWLPQGLIHKYCYFTYEMLSLDPDRSFFAKPDNPKVNIFCAFEIIEHLSNEFEIYQNYLKFGRNADIVMISTPLYTYGGGMDDWPNRELGHLRTYTPSELHAVIAKMFIGYNWSYSIDDTIVLTGRKSK